MTDAQKKVLKAFKKLGAGSFFHAEMVGAEISLNQRAEWQEW